MIYEDLEGFYVILEVYNIDSAPVYRPKLWFWLPNRAIELLRGEQAQLLKQPAGGSELVDPRSISNEWCLHGISMVFDGFRWFFDGFRWV